MAKTNPEAWQGALQTGIEYMAKFRDPLFATGIVHTECAGASDHHGVLALKPIDVRCFGEDISHVDRGLDVAESSPYAVDFVAGHFTIEGANLDEQ